MWQCWPNLVVHSQTLQQADLRMLQCLQMDKTWSAKASRPYDPYLTPKGEEQVGGSLCPSVTVCTYAWLSHWLHGLQLCWRTVCLEGNVSPRQCVLRTMFLRAMSLECNMSSISMLLQSQHRLR